MNLPLVGRIDPKSFAVGAAVGAGLASFVAPVRDAFLSIKEKIMPAKAVTK